MEFTDRITDVWKDINDLDDWQDPLFDWHKARVASVFAKLAYLHIPEYELRNVDRANIIPCREYRERIRQRAYPDVGQILRGSDLSDFFIVEKPYAIAIVVRVRQLLFISMRGTQQLYDWGVNIKAFKSRPCPVESADIHFHKGFHRAAASCMYEIQAEILKRYADGDELTPYITGHSLGGALAAITHAVWNHHYRYFRAPRLHPGISNLTTHSCYTFGMPRYGNFPAIEHFANPFHLYNQADIVPTVPPRFLGFDDSLIEYCLTPSGEVDGSNVKGNTFAQYLIRLLKGEAFSHHDMEVYMERVKQVSSR